MAVVAKYQLYPAASYNWLSATGPVKDIADELKAWVALVNANPGQSGQASSVIRDETSSVSANYYGMAVRMKNPDGRDFYAKLHTTSTGNIRGYAADSYTDDTSNGGYGSTTGYSYGDGSVQFRTSGYDQKVLVAYNTVDGEEWFIVAWMPDSVTYGDAFIIGKTTEGTWAAGQTDGNSNFSGVSTTSDGYMKFTRSGRNSDTASIPIPGIFMQNTSGLAGSGTTKDIMLFKSGNLWSGLYKVFGDWVTVDAATDDYLLYTTSQTGFWVRTK